MALGCPTTTDATLHCGTVITYKFQELTKAGLPHFPVRHETVRQTTGAPDDLMLACGIAIGFEDKDAPINKVRSSRAAVEDFAVFIDR